jgi:ribosomal protein S19E (S16A)
MTAAPTAQWITSSKARPCQVCGRNDSGGDCRSSAEDDRVLCHYGSTFSAPTGLKKGDTTIGADGKTWAFLGDTADGRCAQFKPHQPKGRKHLRVVGSGVTAGATALPSPLPALPSPTTFFFARFLPSMAEHASWQEGEFWHYDQSHRQQRKGTGKEKQLYVHRLEDGKWLPSGRGEWPSWNENCLRLADGVPLYAEGEKVADLLCQRSILGLSMPGHQAESIDHCTTALKRHKLAGLEVVAYLGDKGTSGKQKTAIMAAAAAAADLPFVAVDAGALWPDLPDNGSVDDLGHLEADELIAQLDQAFRDELANKLSSSKGSDALALNGEQNNSSAVNAGAVLALDEEVDEKQAAIHRLVDQLVAARVVGDTVRDAALLSATWRLGVPSAKTDELVLQRWAELRGIATEPPTAPVIGRTIGQATSAEGLDQRLPGFLLEHGLHVLSADAGTGKTFISLEMARLLANGGSGFLDQQEGPTQKGKVLFIGTDGGAGAFDMLTDYATEIAPVDEWKDVIFWCEQAGERKSWSLTLYNLELLAKEVEKGEIKAVVIDTINAVFQGAGISPYLGPVDQYLRLLKAIVCPHGPLIMLGHTNRSGSGIKGIAGSPAFQEVPDALHRIERLKEPQEDGTHIYKWTVEKLRGESFRQFSYARVDGEFKQVEGHYYSNCGDKVLVAIQARKSTGDPTSPKHLVSDTQEAPASVRKALQRLRQKGLLEKAGTGFKVTPLGEQHLASIKL